MTFADASERARRFDATIWIAALGASGAPHERLAAALALAPPDARALLFLADLDAGVGETRASFDRAALQTLGLRRHARLFACVEYAEIEAEAGWVLLPYERVRPVADVQYPLRRLAIERDLHMDMSREAGRRSDAHLSRYRFASERLASDARVLDAACGLGYGSASLWREAPDRSVTGVDVSAWVVEYASVHFGEGGHGPAFRRLDVCDLSVFPEASFDAAVSFETVEHLRDPLPFLCEVRRVLAPGGLFIASVPYRWVIDGDTGPYHHDWYDGPKLLDMCGRFLSVDSLWVQTAGGGPFCTAAPRAWRRCATLGENPADPAEWLIVVACKRRLVRRPQKSWLFLAPGVPQLTTLAAASASWGIAADDVAVVGQSPFWDDAFHAAMEAASSAFGFEYGGNLPVAPSLATVGDPLDFCPDATPVDGEGASARVIGAYPILEDLQHLNVALMVRGSSTCISCADCFGSLPAPCSSRRIPETAGTRSRPWPTP